MQVNELRIGNLVKCKTSNDAGIYTVLGLDGLHLKIYLSEPRNVWHTEDKIKPIPLTEEWMTNFGFHPSTEDLRFIHETLDVEIEKQGNYFAVVICNEECPAISNFILHSQYVHEFQNKIFALTQTELRIK